MPAYTLRTGPELRARVNSPIYLNGLYEHHCLGGPAQIFQEHHRSGLCVRGRHRATQ
jgi:hypothetical protein